MSLGALPSENRRLNNHAFADIPTADLVHAQRYWLARRIREFFTNLLCQRSDQRAIEGVGLEIGGCKQLGQDLLAIQPNQCLRISKRRFRIPDHDSVCRQHIRLVQGYGLSAVCGGLGFGRIDFGSCSGRIKQRLVKRQVGRSEDLQFLLISQRRLPMPLQAVCFGHQRTVSPLMGFLEAQSQVLMQAFVVSDIAKEFFVDDAFDTRICTFFFKNASSWFQCCTASATLNAQSSLGLSLRF